MNFLVGYNAQDFTGYNGDGICGLGFSKLSDDYPTFLDQLKTNKIIEQRSFSFYLSYKELESSKLSELILGGYDDKYMQEPFSYADVVDDEYWAVALEDMNYGDWIFSEQWYS